MLDEKLRPTLEEKNLKVKCTKQDEMLLGVKADAIRNKRTVMIHFQYASVALRAMMALRRSADVTPQTRRMTFFCK